MKRSVIIPCVLSLALAVCGGNRSTPAEATASISGDVQAPPVSADGATIAGSVQLLGTPPPVRMIQMIGDSSCNTGHGATMKSEEVVVDAAGNLANVFVYLRPEDVKGAYAPPADSATIDQQGCHYTPHVMGIQVGQTLNVRNSDPTLHNVHAIAKVNEEFNLGQPVQGMVSEKKFAKPEVMVKFKCDVHGWMIAWVGVLPHPFFATTTTTGSFTIPNIPPGTYTLMAWHEKYGTMSQTVTIGPKETKSVSITFKAS